MIQCLQMADGSAEAFADISHQWRKFISQPEVFTFAPLCSCLLDLHPPNPSGVTLMLPGQRKSCGQEWICPASILLDNWKNKYGKEKNKAYVI